MFKEKWEMSVINKILIAVLAIISVFAVVIICLIQLNKKSTETHVKDTQEIIANNSIYAVTAENTWDVSENGGGSVIATLSGDGTLTISGTGNMKAWTHGDTTAWHGSKIKEKVKNVVINEGVTSIGWLAFEECSSLTSINIPSSVTGISCYAFRGCSSLTEINIPSSVTSIGERAFHECSSLIEIKVDENNTQYMDDNGVLYTKDKTVIIKYPEGRDSTTYKILDVVKSVEDFAFDGCSNLTSINIPEGVTSIGWNAFSGCSGLASINIPEGVTSIEYGAFGGCRSLTSINIPSSVTSIGHSAFFNCSSLISINIQEGVTGIEMYAFSGCSSLTSINIPSSVTGISGYAFSGCSSLTSINGVANIGSYAFKDCSSLTSITIPSNVTRIAGSAFSGCSSLKEIKVAEDNTQYMDDNGVLYKKDKTEMIRYPEGKENTTYTILEGVTSIGEYAFYRCCSLAEINIPSSVTSIGDSALYRCSSLTEINIPEGVTSIGKYAFCHCSNLTNIKIPEGVTSIGDSAFYGCQITKWIKKGEKIEVPNILQRTQSKEDVLYSSKEFSLTNCIIEGTKIIINENETYAKIYVQDGSLYGLAYIVTYNEWDISENGDGSVIATLSEDGTLTISGTGNMKNWRGSDTTDWHVTEIRAGIKNVIINNGVTSIGQHAFDECSSLTSIIIPEGVKSIGSQAFNKCSSLISINIPSGVTSIGEYTFYECSNLTSINIPEVVTSIGSGAFERCSSLTEIKVAENNAKYMDNNGVLYTKDKTKIIRYPAKKEGTEYTILDGVTSVEGSAFDGCSSLTSIDIPEGVTSIGQSAFYGCSGLTSINIPEGVTSIAASAFSGCSSLRSINIPEGVTSIEGSTFWGCSSLTEINIPEGVRSIDTWAFDGCSSLTEINIPEGVTSIGYGTFMGCNNLASINIPSSVTNIGAYAFYGCSSLTSITIPDSVINIGELYTFYKCKKLTIICRSGSTAETYAKENEINYQIDDNAPTVNLSPNGTVSPVKSIEAKITIKDELAGVNENSLKYMWTTESENITKEQIVNSFTNGETLNIKDVTGTYYLWIYAKDNLGNESIVRSEAFVIDNTVPTAKVSYSTTAKTNQNVKVTITANEEIQAVTGWTISTDKKVLTKEYSQNTTETITIKDIAGNETIVNITISNIDKTAPEVKIDYVQETDQSVQVIITVNEEIQAISGWTISTDKKVLTKEYFENITENVTIKDIAGNEKTVEISIMEIVKIFKENTYKVKRSYIVNIQPKTTYENFVKNIETNSQWKITENNKEITGSTLIKTGQQLIIDDQIFTLVVIGDCNGDGQADIKDILAINKHRLNKANLVDEYLQAGDINEDEKVDLRDILQINKYRLGKISEL